MKTGNPKSIKHNALALSAAIFFSAVLFTCTGVEARANQDINQSVIHPSDLDNSINTLQMDAELIIDESRDDLSNCRIELNQHTLTITGNGADTLNIVSISGYGSLIIRGGKLNTTGSVTATSSVEITGGTITACAIHTNGTISISGGTVHLESPNTNAMFSLGNMTISGGNITAISNGNSAALFVGDVPNHLGSTLTISGSDTVVNVSNPDQSPRPAITCFGGITINAPMQITTPDGGCIGYTNTPYSGQNYNVHSILTGEAGPAAHNITIKNPNSSASNPGNPANPTRPGNTNGTPSSGEPKVQAPPHVHSYSWQVIQSPTAESDGYEAYMCSGCGDVKETSPLPALSVFDEEVIAKIKNAPKFGTIKIETTHWNTLGRSIRDALAARPDVTLSISFLSEGHRGIPLKVTLPAGTDIVGLFDENGYLGLCRAGSTLGYDW